VAHLQFRTSQAKAKNCKRATKPTHPNRQEMTTKQTTEKKGEGITAPTRKQGFRAS